MHSHLLDQSTQSGPTPDDVLGLFSSIRRHRRNGVRAPNKPVTLLWALDRVGRGEPRLTPFSVAETELQPLLDACGTPGTASSYAFWRLQNDGIWEVAHAGPLPARSGDKEPRITALRIHARGGFIRAVHEQLASSPSLRRATELLLKGQLKDALPPSARKRDTWQTVRRLSREAAFRNVVLRTYGARCVVCGWSFKMNGRSLALDAAHVRAHSAGGSDTADNGLPLCTFHHPLFDAGLFTWSFRRRLVVSSEWHDDQRGEMPSLLAHQGEVLPGPKFEAARLADGNLAWHRAHVFLG